MQRWLNIEGRKGAEKKEQSNSYVFYINARNTYGIESRSGFTYPLKCFTTDPEILVLTFQVWCLRCSDGKGNIGHSGKPPPHFPKYMHTSTPTNIWKVVICHSWICYSCISLRNRFDKSVKLNSKKFHCELFNSKISKQKKTQQTKDTLAELEVIYQDQILTLLLEVYSLTGWAHMDHGLPFELSISRYLLSQRLLSNYPQTRQVV